MFKIFSLRSALPGSCLWLVFFSACNRMAHYQAGKTREIDAAPALSKNLLAASAVLSRNFTPAKTDPLADLCKIWGFLKYYHPAIGQGLYDWDSTLFSILPTVITDSSRAVFLMEKDLINRLGKIPVCRDCQIPDAGTVNMFPDYGCLFTKNHLRPELMNQLAFIRDNHKTDTAHVYIQQTLAGSVFPRNEINYGDNPYPPSALRLLALFRYWNIIQYFYPYRNLIREDWNKVLTEFIPRFVYAADKKEYLLACLELIRHIHDTHANVWKPADEMDTIEGIYLTPFQAKFIEDKLVVTGYYNDSPSTRAALKIGDIIQKIDNVPVDSLVKRFLVWTPASNYETQLRDLSSARGLLLRSNRQAARLSVLHHDTLREITMQRILLHKNKYIPIDYTDYPDSPVYKLLRADIGYINTDRLKEGDLDTIAQLFKDTRGLIIDMRSYPAVYMPYTYGSWLKPTSSPFVRCTSSVLAMPGMFIWGEPVENGGSMNGSSHPVYKGKLIIIVNSTTQSSAEFTSMALSSVPHALVIGSTTAGADGNVSEVLLPGGVRTLYSGIGIYYPDGSATQRVGIRIDIIVRPTIAGIAAHRDECLEKAIDLIR
jgi:hypothetical protein